MAARHGDHREQVRFQIVFGGTAVLKKERGMIEIIPALQGASVEQLLRTLAPLSVPQRHD